MYCPLCFSESLVIHPKGVAEIYINKKHLDSGRILFNEKMSEGELLRLVEKKMLEFFQWYSKLSNHGPIQSIEILSNNFSCSNRCKLRAEHKFPVTGFLFPAEDVIQIAEQLAPKFQLTIQIQTTAPFLL